ncbi:MAG: hypothetical protein F7B06_05630 [Opitutae bacterium]|nr:hypothetical protein [Opitutae bacterium]MBC9889325.1 hypothetical protein [Opitutae bacterium]
MPKRAKVNGHPVRVNSVIETAAVPEAPVKRATGEGPIVVAATGAPPAPKPHATGNPQPQKACLPPSCPG